MERSDILENCLALEGHEKRELVAGLDFFSEAPSTPHICLNGMSDHGAWTWGNKANSRAFRQSPSKVLCAKGTLESCPKRPFLLPLPFCAQALLASAGLSGRDVGPPASRGRLAGVSPLPSRARTHLTLGGFIQATVGLLLGKQLRSCSGWAPGAPTSLLILDQPTLHILMACQCPDACQRLPWAALIALKIVEQQSVL